MARRSAYRAFLRALRRPRTAVRVAGMIVKEVSYEISEPTVDSQVFALQAAGVDTVLIAATAKAAAQTIRKAYDIGWAPERYLSYISSFIYVPRRRASTGPRG